jgi:hypothetical protein
MLGINLNTGAGDDLTVNGDPAGGNILLGLAPGTDTGPGQYFLNAFFHLPSATVA